MVEIPLKDLSPYKARLQNQVLANRACLFVADKLRSYQGSEANLITGILRTLLLVGVTWASFAVLYVGAVKLNPASIAEAPSLNLFDYVYLSFDNSVFGSHSSVQLTGVESRWLSMYQRFLSGMIVLVFITLLLEVRKRRHSVELEKTISAIESSGHSIEAKIVEEFRYGNIDEAIEDLRRIEASFYGFIMRLSGSIRKK